MPNTINLATLIQANALLVRVLGLMEDAGATVHHVEVTAGIRTTSQAHLYTDRTPASSSAALSVMQSLGATVGHWYGGASPQRNHIATINGVKVLWIEPQDDLIHARAEDSQA